MNKSQKNIALLRGCCIFFFFLITAITVSWIRANIAYLFMFLAIGSVAGLTEFAIAAHPQMSQKIRKASLLILACTLVGIALAIGINFQFSQIFIDLYAGIVTGALIQFTAARLILPFLFGNIFCSRACWDGAAFEFVEKKKTSIAQEHVKQRSTSAWIYMLFIIFFASMCAYAKMLPIKGNAIRWSFVISNILIISIGLILSLKKGSRSYCRKLCPFLTISGIISPFALFKVAPIKANTCIKCNKCSQECPMHIDVMSYIQNDKNINHPDCIMCEKCVSVCPENCIAISWTGLKT